MGGLLTNADKEKIKRVIPKASNKVIDATVARLYVAYPDPTQWTYTDLYGAIVLADDLVGHTFFLKLVDIVGNRGVLWDQELYVEFEYNQDRKFFHSFEIEDCYVGLLFEDTTEASHFYKRVTSRQKYGSKQTVNNKNAIALKSQSKEHKAPAAPGPRGEYVDVNTAQRSRRARGVLYYGDVPPPEWRSLYSELAAAGITEDMIADNRDFIKDYIAKQGGPLVGLEPPVPRRSLNKKHVDDFEVPTRTDSIKSSKSSRLKKAPPPPPPAPASSTPSAPAPPPKDASPPEPAPPKPEPATSSSENVSEVASDHSSPAGSPAPSRPQFRLPPSTAVAPPVSHSNLPPAGAAPSGLSSGPPGNGPAPPRQPMPPPGAQPQQSPFNNNNRVVPPPPPSRGNPPPAPPSRGAPPPAPPPRAQPMSPYATGGQAPPPPPMAPSKTGPQPVTASRTGAPPPPPPPRASRGGPPPPPPPSRNVPQLPPQNSGPPPMPPQRTAGPMSPPAPPMPPQNSSAPPPPPMPPQNTSGAPPPAPPMPPQGTAAGAPPAPPPPPMPPGSSGAPPPPPPPPMPSQSGTGAPPPPPPPPMPSGGDDSGPAPPLPAVDGSRDALLASIRGAGGIGSLKKTDKSQLEKPNVLLQEAKGEKVDPPSSSGGAPGPPGNFADAIQSALNQRKAKVSRSDDEDDGDDW